MNNRMLTMGRLTDDEYLTFCAQDAETRDSNVLRKAAGFQIDHITDPVQLDRLIAHARQCRRDLPEN